MVKSRRSNATWTSDQKRRGLSVKKGSNRSGGSEHAIKQQFYPGDVSCDRSACDQHRVVNRPGRSAGHNQPDGISALQSECASLQPASGPTKVLAFAQDNEREFMQGVDHGLALAAKDRGLEYRRRWPTTMRPRWSSRSQLSSSPRSARSWRRQSIRPR